MIIHWSAALGAKWCFLGRWEAVMHIGTVAPYGEMFPGKGIGAKRGFTGLWDRAQGVFSRFQTWKWVSNTYRARSANGIKLPCVPLEFELNPQKQGWQVLFTPTPVAELSLEEVILLRKRWELPMPATNQMQSKSCVHLLGLTWAEITVMCPKSHGSLERSKSVLAQLRDMGWWGTGPSPGPRAPRWLWALPQQWWGAVAAVALPRANPIACEEKGESWSDCPH